jgi:hypothetical protein
LGRFWGGFKTQLIWDIWGGFEKHIEFVGWFFLSDSRIMWLMVSNTVDSLNAINNSQLGMGFTSHVRYKGWFLI